MRAHVRRRLLLVRTALACARRCGWAVRVGIGRTLTSDEPVEAANSIQVASMHHRAQWMCCPLFSRWIGGILYSFDASSAVAL
mmetsp:Transcript_17909/g.47488  ORF Transcript_17909/g.47488 Transcript_17909/m.47488 type:complete len:83 (-) Transcript_17909:1264-1512(-)